jgi:serine protease Do
MTYRYSITTGMMMKRTPRKDNRQESAPFVAALEYLTGSHRGNVTWLGQASSDVILDKSGLVHLISSKEGMASKVPVARFSQIDGGFKIEAVKGKPVWVNGKPIKSIRLENHDVIEFGETGPISRYFIYFGDRPDHQTITDILGDTIAYLRISRQPVWRRVLRAAGHLSWRLRWQSTILFRVGVIIAMVIIAVLAYQQHVMNDLLQRQIAIGAAQLESFSRSITQARKEALTSDDLEILRQDFGSRIAVTKQRVGELERRSTASGRIITEAISSIVFLQGAYGFKERNTGRFLRHEIDLKDKPIFLPNGLPLLSIEGKGPIAERQFAGTAFAVGNNGTLVTSRHLGLPWESDTNVQALSARGLEPAMIRFIGYLSGEAESNAVKFLVASEEADIALLSFAEAGKQVKGLKLALDPPTSGDEVILLGYPTGLRSMLAQSGEHFIKEIQKSKKFGFWEIASQLAKVGRIIPLASRGIIGRVSDETIVYDAETTHGGSGGPVLNIEGSVIAINAAILAEYGGSNLGVPVSKLVELIEKAGLKWEYGG